MPKLTQKVNSGFNNMKKAIKPMTKPLGANKTPFHQRNTPGLAVRAMKSVMNMITPAKRRDDNAFAHLKRGTGGPAGPNLKKR